MAKDRTKSDKGAPADDSGAPFNNPFGALAALKAQLPPSDKGPLVVPLEKTPKGPARAVVRLERKGHGGKEVTRVEKLGLPDKQLQDWCVALKQQLGCGGIVDGDALQFQGDQRTRLPPLLQARGVREVVKGS